jgi:hypothetical protein
LGPFELAVLVAFAGLSIWLLVSLVLQSGPDHVWTGTDGPFIGDQMQFVGWIADASHHLLVSNPFQSSNTAGVYLHPGVLLSGLLVRLGLRPTTVFLLWKPVGVAALFGAVLWYTRSLLRKVSHRRAALVLALFFISPVAWLTQYVHGVSPMDRLGFQAFTTEMWPGLYLWGYPFTVLSVALMPLTILFYERDRRDRRLGLWAPLCGLFCAWLQPWQGGTLLVILVICEGILWWKTKKVHMTLLAINGAAIFGPLAYYAILGRVNSAWAQAGHVNLIAFPYWTLALVLVPLGIPALLAYRLPAATFQDIALRIWPVVALGVYGLISVFNIGTFPLHAMQGISIPLAVLAVIGASSLRLPWTSLRRLCIGIVLVAVLVAPSLSNELNEALAVGRPTFFGTGEPYFITSSEQSALKYLQIDREPGSVLAPIYLGQLVPALTGRRTWLGIASWTPDFINRIVVANDLFSDHLPTKRAVRLVESSGARFLLSDCEANSPLGKTLAPILISEKRFGCSTVYTVATSSEVPHDPTAGSRAIQSSRPSG